MKDENKTKEQLIDELVEMRNQIAAQEASIAEYKQEIQSLRESEERFRLSNNAVKGCAIFFLDLEGQIISWHTGAKEIYGYHADEITSQHFSCLYPDKDIERDKSEQRLKAVMTEGRLQEEVWHARKDGSRLWARSVMTLLQDEGGNVRGFSGVVHDMTERKQKKAKPPTGESRVQADGIYINELRKRGTTVQVFLINGASLTGKIEAFSPYALILRSQNRQQLVQRNSIISIRPQKAHIYEIFKTKELKKPRPEKKD